MLRCFALCAALFVTPVTAQEGAEGDVIVDPPFTLDNSACPAFLTGIWLATSQQDVAPGPGEALWSVTEAMVFNAGGMLEHAFASGVAGDEPEETKTFGTWTAGPGAAPDRCALSLVFEEGETRAGEVVVTGQTGITIDGQAFTRIR